jgi:hypothetical protein
MECWVAHDCGMIGLFVACGTKTISHSVKHEAITRDSISATFGSPERIEVRFGDEWRPIEEGGGYADSVPYEHWHYTHMDGIGDDRP